MAIRTRWVGYQRLARERQGHRRLVRRQRLPHARDLLAAGSPRSVREDEGGGGHGRLQPVGVHELGDCLAAHQLREDAGRNLLPNPGPIFGDRLAADASAVHARDCHHAAPRGGREHPRRFVAVVYSWERAKAATLSTGSTLSRSRVLRAIGCGQEASAFETVMRTRGFSSRSAMAIRRNADVVPMRTRALTAWRRMRGSLWPSWRARKGSAPAGSIASRRSIAYTCSSGE